MLISRLTLKNSRNFQHADDIPLRQRQFIVGPSASGKSNLLYVFRFLRDIAKFDGGGFQKAVKNRGGVSKMRCLAARRDPEIFIDISLSNDTDATDSLNELFIISNIRFLCKTYDMFIGEDSA